MTWATMPTFTDGNALTGAQMEIIKANLLETAPAKATTAGYHFVATGTNAIAQRGIDDAIVETSNFTTSTSYVDIGTPGPALTMTTGTRAVIWTNASMSNSATNVGCYASFEITGATTNAAIDARAIIWNATLDQSLRMGVCSLNATTAGSNTFNMQYRAGGNTATFTRRRIQVMGL